MRRTTWKPWLAVLLVIAAACGDSGSPTEPEDVIFASTLGIDLTQMTKLPSGVYVQTTTPGSGTAEITATNNWAMNYKFWLPDGRLLDQGGLVRNDGPFIEGFEIGILGLKVGEVRKLVIPSRLGYGPDEYAGIPGNSVLVYEVVGVSILN